MVRTRAFKNLGLLLILIGVGASTGCLSPGSSAPTGLVSGGGTTTVTPSISADLYLQVSAAWETTPTAFNQQFLCQIPLGSATSVTTCSGKIPEGQLHFSKLQFTVGTSNPTICKMIVFYPYFYLGSQVAAYNPPWDPTITGAVCNDTSTGFGGPAEKNCYDGVAKEIVTDFPKFTGMYFLTAFGLETTYVASSANLIHHPSNRYTCNNKVDKTAAVVVGGNSEYVANSMHDYVVQCRDEYYTLLKQITVTIGDADIGTGENPGGPEDNFNDWLTP